MCLDILCCCFGPAACGLCCLPSCKAKSSLTTRLLYLPFLLVIVILSAVMLSPAVKNALVNSVLCVGYNTSAVSVDPIDTTIVPGVPVIPGSEDACEAIIGYLAVYRVCMGLACFFFMMMILMLCVFSSRDPRSYIQNGFWCFKWLVVITLIIGFFFIPTSGNFTFSKVCVVLGMLGGIIFIIIQVVFLVDLAHSWAEKWLDKQAENENNCWYVALLIFTILFYFVSVVGIILMFVFFTTPGGCGLNIFFLITIILLSIGVSVFAILPFVRRAQPRSGLLQASVVTLYTVYLTYSALSNEPYGPDNNCPLIPPNDSNSSDASGVGNVYSDNNELIVSILGIALLFLTVAYTSIHLSNNGQVQKLRGNHKDETEQESALIGDYHAPDSAEEQDKGLDDDDDDDDDDERRRMRVHDDERDHVTYSYSFFHFMLLISVLYVMMQLTNWYNPGGADTTHFQNTWASVWVKMGSAWFCYLLYFWTLLAPVVLTNRDFGYGTE